jgi:hypothetical protein
MDYARRETAITSALLNDSSREEKRWRVDL